LEIGPENEHLTLQIAAQIYRIETDENTFSSDFSSTLTAQNKSISKLIDFLSVPSNKFCSGQLPTEYFLN